MDKSRFGWRHLAQNPAIRIATVAILAFTSIGAWALSSPVGSSPDDDFHLTSIWCAGDGYPDVCEKADVENQRLVAAAFEEATCFKFKARQSAACQPELDDVSNSELVISDRGNFTGLYPPVFYSVMHAFTSANLEFSAVLMRFVTIFIFITLSIVLWIAAPREMRPMLTIPWLLTSIPLGIFLFASNNPSSWALIGIGTSTLALHGLLARATSAPIWRTILLGTVYVIATLMATGARADSIAFILLAAAAVVFLNFRVSRDFFRRLLILMIPIALGLMFTFTASQTSSAIAGGLKIVEEERSPIYILGYNLFNLPDLYFGVWGGWGLGWLDTPIPLIIPSLLLIIFVAYLAIAWQLMTKRQIVIHLALVIVMIALPIYLLQVSDQIVGESLQPRYLLPLVILMGITMMYPLSQGKIIGGQFFRYVVWVSLSSAYSVTLLLNTTRYVYGYDQPNVFSATQGWWWQYLPLHPLAVVMLGSLAFLALAWFLLRPWDKNALTMSQDVSLTGR